MTTIVILGASYAGVSTAHRLLKQTAKNRNLKIILVSPNTHFYWNIASTRAIVPGQLSDESIFEPIAPGFKQYTADVFEFVVGSAHSLDIEAKKVIVAAPDRQLELNYDLLILATGSQTKGNVPFKGRGSYDATRDALHDFQQQVKKATSICIAGAGSTGVELAGELGFEFGTKKKITLIGSGAQLLEGTPASVAKTAMQQLQSLRVDVKLKTKVVESAKTSGGSTELTLSDGQKMVTDLYLPTVGLSPNSSYVPQHLLNDNGFVMVDKYLRVKGSKDIWAAGDISDIQRPQFMNAEKQSVHLVKNIILVLNNKEPVLYNPGSTSMLAVPIGRKAGTGHMGSWKLPSFMVNMVKGKTLFADKMRPTVSGSAF